MVFQVAGGGKPINPPDYATAEKFSEVMLGKWGACLINAAVKPVKMMF